MAAKHARYLEKDGEIHLYAKEDVEAAQANGWEDPKGARGNGQPWNPEQEGDEILQVDAIADAQSVKSSKKK